VKKLTEEWITKAEEDYLVAIRELKANPPALGAVCFHSQQCIEKYIKAILQENEVEFEKIHDLDVLQEQCKMFISEIATYRDELVRLSIYSVDVRYPGLQVSEREATICSEIMEKLRKVIRHYFKLSLEN